MPSLEIPKNATPEEIKKALAKFEAKRKKLSKGKLGNAAKFFGMNPNEVDGLTFQKRVRAEWN